MVLAWGKYPPLDISEPIMFSLSSPQDQSFLALHYASLARPDSIFSKWTEGVEPSWPYHWAPNLPAITVHMRDGWELNPPLG